MGWASGSEMAQELVDLVTEVVPKSKQEYALSCIANLFADNDCDTLDEVQPRDKEAEKIWRKLLKER